MLQVMSSNSNFNFASGERRIIDYVISSSSAARLEEPRTSSPEFEWPEGIEPTDVLCGRDKLSHAHCGNKRFRDIIGMNREAYQTAPSRERKTSITCQIVSIVREFGGRFLRVDDATREWVDIGDTHAREKVSHALRNAKDPNRPRIRKRRAVRIHVPSPEEDALFEETLRDQQRIFQSLMEREAQGMPEIEFEDTISLISDL
jgi:hypothetical protein